MGKGKKGRKGIQCEIPNIDLTIHVGGIPKEKPEQFDEERPSWSFSVASRDFYSIPEDGNELSEIIRHLRDFEGMTIRELLGKKSTSGSYLLTRYGMDVLRTSLIDDAVSYLDKFHPDVMELYRFRLGNKKRLYTLRNGSVFALLWWDPNHEIYNIERD